MTQFAAASHSVERVRRPEHVAPVFRPEAPFGIEWIVVMRQSGRREIEVMARESRS
jgi:hypothetical protein